jgi:hypothetical protein
MYYIHVCVHIDFLLLSSILRKIITKKLAYIQLHGTFRRCGNIVSVVVEVIQPLS